MPPSLSTRRRSLYDQPPLDRVAGMLDLLAEQPLDNATHERLTAEARWQRSLGRSENPGTSARQRAAAGLMIEQAAAAERRGGWRAGLLPACQAVALAPHWPEALAAVAARLLAAHVEQRAQQPADRVTVRSPAAPLGPDHTCAHYLRLALDADPLHGPSLRLAADLLGRQADWLGVRCCYCRLGQEPQANAVLVRSGGRLAEELTAELARASELAARPVWRLRRIVAHQDFRGKARRADDGLAGPAVAELHTHLSAAAYTLIDLHRWSAERGHRWQQPRANVAAFTLTSAGPLAVDLSPWFYRPFAQFFSRTQTPKALERDLEQFARDHGR